MEKIRNAVCPHASSILPIGIACILGCQRCIQHFPHASRLNLFSATVCGIGFTLLPEKYKVQHLCKMERSHPYERLIDIIQAFVLGNLISLGFTKALGDKTLSLKGFARLTLLNVGIVSACLVYAIRNHGYYAKKPDEWNALTNLEQEEYVKQFFKEKLPPQDTWELKENFPFNALLPIQEIQTLHTSQILWYHLLQRHKPTFLSEKQVSDLTEVLKKRCVQSPFSQGSSALHTAAKEKSAHPDVHKENHTHTFAEDTPKEAKVGPADSVPNDDPIAAGAIGKCSAKDGAPPSTLPEIDPVDVIESRTEILAEKRASDPGKYPSYLENLLEKGYIHLYDHLLDMKKLPNRIDREEKIRTLPFSEISHIILETRQAIIDAVSIPPNKPSLFILGLTDSGKTTTLCFLRGDKMEYDNENGAYLSSSPQGDLIGHDSTQSCTFLPNTEELEDLTIVDYPGFEDTNGSLVALGVECALKFLTYTHQPKILVTQSLTSIGRKHEAQQTLSIFLRRSLGNLESCVLGLTQYSSRREYSRLKEIEEVQRAEKKSASKGKIEGKILYLQKLIQELDDFPDHPEIQSMKEAKKAKLAGLQSQGPLLEEPLEDTDEKRNLRERLEKTEREILCQIRLNPSQKISLVDLEDPQKRESVLRRILEIEETPCHTIQQEVSSDHERLLIQRFEEEMIPRIKDRGSREFENFDTNDLERKTLESSLIHALFFETRPEIGQLFHLQEMDPMIVQKLSKEAIEACKYNLMDTLIQEVNFARVSEVIKHSKANPEIIAKVKEKQDDLKQYILHQYGEVPRDSETLDDKWKAFRNRWKGEPAKQGNKMSLLQHFGGCALLGVPLWLNKRAAQNKTVEETSKSHDETCEEYVKDLDCAFKSLIKLEEMKKQHLSNFS